MTTLVITSLDMQMLAFLEEVREADVVDLVRRFYSSAKSTVTGAPSKHPKKQCMRRLSKLRAHGYVDLLRVRDGTKTRSVALLAVRANQPLAAAASRRVVHPMERVHHLRTLDALRVLERDINARGGRVLRVDMEHALRAKAQHGRRTRRGDSFSSFPDAVCVAVVRTPTGEMKETTIAIEYVTSKYTDADIRAKHESFRTTYDDAVWFADKARTAERVNNITEFPCSILS